MCPICRREQWYEQHADELEFLIVAKGYTLNIARTQLTKMLRPICRACGKPIKGGTPGGTLFCKRNNQCHRQYLKYRRLLKQGLTISQALSIIKHH
jgi:hypothetical protein